MFVPQNGTTMEYMHKCIVVKSKRLISELKTIDKKIVFPATPTPYTFKLPSLF